jgi:hypothetical protein
LVLLVVLSRDLARLAPLLLLLVVPSRVLARFPGFVDGSPEMVVSWSIFDRFPNKKKQPCISTSPAMRSMYAKRRCARINRSFCLVIIILTISRMNISAYETTQKMVVIS